MSLTNRLQNPTPWEVRINWDRGIDIVIPPFGETELTVAQMDDFRPGKPGSEDVQNLMDFHGIFLLDSNRTYNVQALEAVERAIEKKTVLYREVRESTRKSHQSESGQKLSEEALEEQMRMLGYDKFGRQVERLKKMARNLSEAVGDRSGETVKERLDPARTVFVVDPPRQFPTVEMMEEFLDENPDIRDKHEAMRGKAPAPKKGESREAKSPRSV